LPTPKEQWQKMVQHTPFSPTHIDPAQCTRIVSEGMELLSITQTVLTSLWFSHSAQETFLLICFIIMPSMNIRQHYLEKGLEFPIKTGRVQM